MSEANVTQAARARMQRARLGSALMVLGGGAAAVSFFLPWVMATPHRPAPASASSTTSPWTLVKIGGPNLVFLALLGIELAIALAGALHLLGQRGPLRLEIAAILCVPALLASLYAGWVALVAATLNSPYLVSTSIDVGPWLTILGLVLALVGSVIASTAEGPARS
jgi:hypothetical protein